MLIAINEQAVPERKLQIAVLGCGRMGQRHCRNVAYSCPRAELAAVCDPNPKVQQWAKANLPPRVKYIADAEDVFRLPGLDAVLIATVTSTHASLAVKAIEAGLHVLLEKPISTDVGASMPVIEAAQARPDLKVMIGFSRRFDESYKEAKARIDSGQLGKVYMIKSVTNDQYDPSGFFVAYSKASGGIFIDCGIHDIDISRWLLDVANPAGLANPKKQVSRVFASGLSVRHPELGDQGDCDNALAVVEYENGTVCTFHLSRTAVHGHECSCEVFGTESKIVINGNPSSSRLEIRDSYGVRTESTPTYYERFRDAFVHEVNHFVDCVLGNKPVLTNPRDALEAAQIAVALTHSFRMAKPVLFGEDGQPILD